MRPLIFLLFSVSLILTSCRNITPEHPEGNNALTFRHATLLKLTEGNGYTTATITNPWDSTAILHQYILIPKDSTPTASQFPEGDILRIPLSNTVIESSVHMGLFSEFHAMDAVKGVFDSQYMVQDDVKSRLASGAIQDLGSSSSPNIEKVITLSPDAIFMSPYQNSGGYGRLSQYNIPIIECADYMEVNPLARAEWMRFYALLLGKTDLADSIFSSVEANYLQLKDRVGKACSDSLKRPTVLSDLKYGSSWYVASGESTTGQFFRDAGANYIFADVPGNASVAYSPEYVFEKAQNADIWLIKYNQPTPKTYSQLLQEYPNYGKIRAFQNHNIYGCNTSVYHFYEELPFHPDILLQEYTKLFHPSLLPNYNPKYFYPL